MTSVFQWLLTFLCLLWVCEWINHSIFGLNLELLTSLIGCRQITWHTQCFELCHFRCSTKCLGEIISIYKPHSCGKDWFSLGKFNFMYQNLVLLTYLILCRQGLDYLPHMMLRAMTFKVFVKVPQRTYPIVKPIF